MSLLHTILAAYNLPDLLEVVIRCLIQISITPIIISRMRTEDPATIPAMMATVLLLPPSPPGGGGSDGPVFRGVGVCTGGAGGVGEGTTKVVRIIDSVQDRG